MTSLLHVVLFKERPVYTYWKGYPDSRGTQNKGWSTGLTGSKSNNRNSRCIWNVKWDNSKYKRKVWSIISKVHVRIALGHFYIQILISGPSRQIEFDISSRLLENQDKHISFLDLRWVSHVCHIIVGTKDSLLPQGPVSPQLTEATLVHNPFPESM